MLGFERVSRHELVNLQAFCICHLLSLGDDMEWSNVLAKETNCI